MEEHAKGGRLQPAQMFFGRRQRTRLPTLPVHHAPIDNKLAEAARRKTAEENTAVFNQHTREQERLEQGQQVWLQDPKTGRWTVAGEVVNERPHGGSYVVETEAGRTTTRNRSHIRPKVGMEECAETAIPAAPVTLIPRRSARLQGELADGGDSSTPQVSVRFVTAANKEWPALPAPFRLSYNSPTSSSSEARAATRCLKDATTSISLATRTASSRSRVEGSTSSSSTSGLWGTASEHSWW